MPPVHGLHYDKPLTDMSVAYIQDQKRFVARNVFPQVTTEKISDVYYVWDKDDYMRDEAQKRAPNTESARTMAKPSTQPFLCEEWALGEDIAWQRRDNADKVLNAEQAAVNRISQKLLIRQDRLWASKYFKTGLWGVDITGVDNAPGANQLLKWTQTGSSPVQDVGALKLRVEEQTGYVPNVMVITPRVLEVLKNHPDIMERIKYTETGIITVELLRAVFDVERVLVGRAIVNTSKKGDASQTRRFILDDGMLLAYAADAPGVETPSAGYTFAWQDLDSGAGEYGGGFRKFANESRKCDTVEGEFALDFRIVGQDLGVFATSII